MAGDRSKKIKDRIKLITGLSDTLITDSLIYAICDNIAQKVAEETICIEKNATLTVDGTGEVTEPAGLFRIKIVVMPTSTYTQPVEVDVITFDELKRINPTALDSSAKVYKRWVNTSEVRKISFYPVSAGNYTILYNAIPTTVITDIVDPETPAKYDNLFYYGALAELLPIQGKLDIAGYFRELFVGELLIAKNTNRTGKTVSNFIKFYDI